MRLLGCRMLDADEALLPPASRRRAERSENKAALRRSISLAFLAASEPL